MNKGATFILLLISQCHSKYLEGVINTSNNWAFLARFCFLSEQGAFEYYLEFNEDQGIPNLLLYYDTEDQWPAVYKTPTTCTDKESVLDANHNQIINLTARYDIYRDASGCAYMETVPTTQKPKYTIKLPKLPNRTTKSINFKTTSTTTTVASTTHFFDAETGFTFSSSNPTDSTVIEDFTSTRHFETTKSGTTPQALKNDKAPIEKRSLQQPLPPLMRPIGDRMIACHNARHFRSARERWWFIALSNCNGTKGIHVKYKLLMTNGPPGDYWHEQFSADEFYILPVLMAFCIAYSFLLLGIIICSIELKSRQLLHTTYKIFVFSVLLQLFGIILSSASYLKYALNGVGPSKALRIGNIFMGGSETTFLLLLLLLAKGYTVTRGRLPVAASIKLTIFMCLYVVTYISIFIYEANVFDPGEVLYLYESPAGYGLIILRISAWCMFIYSTVFTLKHYPEKSNFYYPFNVCGTLWFIAGPAFILSANTYIDKWVRESVVCAVLQFITFGGHLMFLILTMPSVANKNFPYHVRTTQIGIMELTGGAAGANNIEQFGHHNYEPAGMYNQPVHHDIRRDSLNDEEYNIARDVMMKNVINWSLAKNISAIEVPNPETFGRSSFASSVNSRNSDTESVLSRRPSNSQNNVTYHEYVRDVPIELFTVSRMVVANGNHENNDKNEVSNGKST